MIYKTYLTYKRESYDLKDIPDLQEEMHYDLCDRSDMQDRHMIYKTDTIYRKKGM